MMRYSDVWLSVMIMSPLDHVRAGAASKRTAGRCLGKVAVNNYGTWGHMRNMCSIPPSSRSLKLIKQLTEDEGGIELRSRNAFWWNPALSPLAMYHAMLARAHRLQTRCREARLRVAAALNPKPKN